MEYRTIILILLVLGALYYYFIYLNQKHVIIKEKDNKEYFLVISDVDKILKSNNTGGYICSRQRKQDMQDVVSMHVIR